MKHLFKKVFLNTVAIAAVATILPGLSYNSNIKTLVISAIVLALINIFIKPLIKILLIPINIVTLGLAGWLINVIILLLTTLLVTGLSVQPFTLTLFNANIVFSLFWAYIAISFMLSFVTTTLNWIVK